MKNTSTTQAAYIRGKEKGIKEGFRTGLEQGNRQNAHFQYTNVELNKEVTRLKTIARDLMKMVPQETLIEYLLNDPSKVFINLNEPKKSGVIMGTEGVRWGLTPETGTLVQAIHAPFTKCPITP